MKDRLASLLSGAWLMGSLMMFVVAPTNFRLVDELLAHSENQSFRALVEHLGSGPTRELLRYLSSELNREFFQRWNIVQVLLGAGLLLIVSKRTEAAGGVASFQRQQRRVRLPLVLATVLVVGLLVGLTPLITSLGRSLDFVPREPAPPALAHFKLLHVGYTVLELIKVVCVGIAAYWLTRGDPQAAGVARLHGAPVEATSGK
jgi:hypothetical protein